MNELKLEIILKQDGFGAVVDVSADIFDIYNWIFIIEQKQKSSQAFDAILTGND